jgi:transcriptional regulator with XRE-family HTH domain
LDVESIGDRVYWHRDQRDWTQEELAHQAGVSATTVSHIESGAKQPRMNTIRRLARAFGVSTDELLHGKELVPPKVETPPSPEPSFNDVIEERRLSRFATAIIAAAETWSKQISNADMNNSKRFGLIDAALDLSDRISEHIEEEVWETLTNQERHEIITTMEKLGATAGHGLRHLQESSETKTPETKAQEEEVKQRRDQIREWTRHISA